MRHRISITLILISVLLTCAMVPITLAQTTGPYYKETGHRVSSIFWNFFQTTGGLTRYGFPITEAYDDPVSGIRIQYFQRARLEWHPENPKPYQIQLGLLGDELGKRTPPIPVSQIPPASDPNCYYFPETGHTACMKFFEHWTKTGGLDMYGYPITEYLIENDHIVQYFQRTRMEWDPNTQRITLAALGKIYYDYAKLDPARLVWQPESAAAPTAVTAIFVDVSLKNSVVSRNSQQTVTVSVTDQRGLEVNGAVVALVIKYPGGTQQTITMPATNAKGRSEYVFNIGSVSPGSVINFEALVNYPGVTANSDRTSCMVWFF